MYSTQVFLARRKLQTVRLYKRSLARFAKHVGSDSDHLHEYLETTFKTEDGEDKPNGKEQLTSDLITFADTLTGLNQNTQRIYLAAVMSFLSYNEITVPKAQKTQIIPKKGDRFPDKALSVVEVKRVYEYLPPIGRALLLLMFTTGARISELLQVRESDMDGKVIHLKGSYTKSGVERDIVMSTECHNFITTIWLPQKSEYLKQAQNKNKGLAKQENTEKRAGTKKLVDDRIIPIAKNTGYPMLMRAFRLAGFDARQDDRFLYHPHGLRKSFRSIVGSQNPDLAERLMGHSGYMSENYVRFNDIVAEYEKIEHLLTLSGNAGNGRLKSLETENAELKAQLHTLKEQVNELRENFGNFKSETAPFEAYLKRVLPELKPLGKPISYEQYLKETGQ